MLDKIDITQCDHCIFHPFLIIFHRTDHGVVVAFRPKIAESTVHLEMPRY